MSSETHDRSTEEPLVAGRTIPVWLPAMIAGTAAALLRLLYVFDFRDSIAFTLPIMDEAIHDLWARGQSTMFHEGVPYFRAPLYMWFLEAIYAIDPGYLLPRVAQALLSALTVSFVADLGRRLAGPVAGLAAGLLLALYWPSIYFAGELLIVTLFVTLLTAALWCFVVGTSSDRPWLVWAAAALLGIASIARPTALTFLPALPLLAWWTWPRLDVPRLGARRGRHLVVMLVLVLLPGLVLTVRNRIEGDDWVFIASQGGVNFYIGNNPESDGQRAVVPGTRGTWLGGYEDTIARAEQDRGRELKPSEVSRYYYEQGLRYWIEEPLDALQLYGLKLRKLLGAAERPNNKNLHFWRAQSDVLRWPVYPGFAPLLALGLVGIVLCRRRVQATPLWAFLALYAVGLLLFFLNERFRLPVATVLAVFAGIAVAHLVALARSRQWRVGAVVLAAVLVIWGTSSADRIGFHNDRVDVDAFSRSTMGNMYLRKDEYRAALSEYQTALDISRRYPLKHFDEVERMVRKNMVRALFGLGEYEVADQHLDRLEAERAEDPELWVLRGRQQLWRHRFDRALPQFKRALEAGYVTAEPLLGLAWCQIEGGSNTAAQRTFQQALELDRGSAEALAGLAMVELMGRRNVERAKRMAIDALERDWDTARAHEVLTQVYRRQQNTPRVIYHAREVMRLDPNNNDVEILLNRMGLEHDHPAGTDRPTEF